MRRAHNPPVVASIPTRPGHHPAWIPPGPDHPARTTLPDTTGPTTTGRTLLLSCSVRLCTAGVTQLAVVSRYMLPSRVQVLVPLSKASNVPVIVSEESLITK